MEVGFWWVIFGTVVGLIVYLALLVKFCTVVVRCPYCYKKTEVGKGVFEYNEPFDCLYCKRTLYPKDFVQIRKKGKKKRSSGLKGAS